MSHVWKFYTSKILTANSIDLINVICIVIVMVIAINTNLSKSVAEVVVVVAMLIAAVVAVLVVVSVVIVARLLLNATISLVLLFIARTLSVTVYKHYAFNHHFYYIEHRYCSSSAL
jgi:hypothetical protein